MFIFSHIFGKRTHSVLEHAKSPCLVLPASTHCRPPSSGRSSGSFRPSCVAWLPVQNKSAPSAIYPSADITVPLTLQLNNVASYVGMLNVYKLPPSVRIFLGHYLDHCNYTIYNSYKILSSILLETLFLYGRSYSCIISSSRCRMEG